MSELPLRRLSKSEADSLRGVENEDPDNKEKRRAHAQALFPDTEKTPTKENRAEREGVLAVLHRYYQMTNFNTDLHRELADAIEKGEDEKKISELDTALRKQNLRIFKETIVALGYGNLLSDVSREDVVYDKGSQSPRWKCTPFIEFARTQRYTMWNSHTKKPLEIETDRLYCHGIADIIELKKVELGITDEEIARVLAIEWSAQEREKIEKLKRAVRVWQEGLPDSVPQRGSFLGNFSDSEYRIVLANMTVAKAREYYDKLELPLVHRERLISELKISGEIKS